MNTINSRIKKIREEYAGRNNDFAEIMGEKKNTVNNWVREGYSVGYAVILKMADKFPEIDLNWLVTGSGPMFKTKGLTTIETKSPDIQGVDIINTIAMELNDKNEILPIDRIIQFQSFMKPTHGGQNKFETHVGISISYLNKMQKQRGDVSIEVLNRIAGKFPELDLNWIITGSGPMLKTEKNASNVITLPEVPKVESENTSLITSLLEIIKNQGDALKAIALNEDEKRSKEQDDIKREIGILRKILGDQDKLLRDAYTKLESLESDNKIYKQKNAG